MNNPSQIDVTSCKVYSYIQYIASRSAKSSTFRGKQPQNGAFPMPDPPADIFTSDLEPPVDYGWLSESQYEHLLNVIAQPGGAAVARQYALVISLKVERYREQDMHPEEIVETVMEQAKEGYPGIDESDLLPLTRGLITCVLKERDRDD
jgi:hypothetical protein